MLAAALQSFHLLEAGFAAHSPRSRACFPAGFLWSPHHRPMMRERAAAVRALSAVSRCFNLPVPSGAAAHCDPQAAAYPDWCQLLSESLGHGGSIPVSCNAVSHHTVCIDTRHSAACILPSVPLLFICRATAIISTSATTLKRSHNLVPAWRHWQPVQRNTQYPSTVLQPVVAVTGVKKAD